MKIVIAVTVAAVAVSGCLGVTPSPFQRGNVVLAGDADGVEALMDGLNGFVTNGASQDPQGNSAHWEHRKVQEVQKTRRSCSNCGFFNKLAGSGGESQGMVK
jgi:hypothetical protein